MRIVLTGGAGFIGSHIARALLAEGHEVIILDNLSSGKREQVPEGARLEVLDIRSEEAARLLLKEAPEALVHHAAQIDVRRSVADPRFDSDVNVGGTLNLLEACVRAGTKKVVFASTGGAIYGEQDVFPAGEGHSRRPTSPYGCAKASVELYLGYYGEVHGLSWIALRYANVYGPNQDPHGEAGVVAIFCNRLLEGNACTIFGDGTATRDYVYVGDVARANLLALKSDYQGPINIGTGKETDVATLHGLLAEAAGALAEPVLADARAGEQRRSCIDPSLAAEILGWAPEVELARGLSATLEHFRKERG